MKEERIVEEMANLDGLTPVLAHGFTQKAHSINNEGSCFKLPDYLADHNAVQRVVDGLDENSLTRYTLNLSYYTGGQKDSRWKTGEVCKLLLASCYQKCEAILRAVGKWEEGE